MLILIHATSTTAHSIQGLLITTATSRLEAQTSRTRTVKPETDFRVVVCLAVRPYVFALICSLAQGLTEVVVCFEYVGRYGDRQQRCYLHRLSIDTFSNTNTLSSAFHKEYAHLLGN